MPPPLRVGRLRSVFGLQCYSVHVRYVQLWNEPNLSEEWGRRPVDAGAYVELLRAGYAGAKRADPGVRVVTAALAQTLEPDVPTAAGLDDRCGANTDCSAPGSIGFCRIGALA